MFSLFLIPIILAFVICVLVVSIATKAVVFSKIVFSLFVALVINLHTPFPINSQFLSFCIWAAITNACCFVLCRLVRFNWAFQLFCNFTVSYVISELLSAVALSIFLDNYEPTVTSEILVKAVCLVLSIVSLLIQIKASNPRKSLNSTVIKLVDRFLASIIYGVTALIVFSVSINGLWKFSVFVDYAIFGGTTIVTFLVDLYLFHFIQNFADNYRKKPTNVCDFPFKEEEPVDSSFSLFSWTNEDAEYWDEYEIDRQLEEEREARQREDDYYYDRLNEENGY